MCSRVPETCCDCLQHTQPHVPLSGMRSWNLRFLKGVQNGCFEQPRPPSGSRRTVLGSGHGCRGSGQGKEHGENRKHGDGGANAVPTREGSRRNAAHDHEAQVKQPRSKSQGRGETSEGMFSGSEISGKDIALDRDEATGKRSRSWCQSTRRP